MPIANDEINPPLSAKEMGRLNRKLAPGAWQEMAPQFAGQTPDPFAGPFNTDPAKAGNARGFMGQKAAQAGNAYAQAARRPGAYGFEIGDMLEGQARKAAQADYIKSLSDAYPTRQFLGNFTEPPLAQLPYDAPRQLTYQPAELPPRGPTPIPRNAMKPAPRNLSSVLAEEWMPPPDGHTERTLGRLMDAGNATAEARFNARFDPLRAAAQQRLGVQAMPEAMQATESLGARTARRLGDIAREGGSFVTSGALDAAGAAPAAASMMPYLKSAVGALPGMAARYAGPVALGASIANNAFDAFTDPNSEIRNVSKGAKADMARDWEAGNYGRAAGDAVRAMAATGAKVVGDTFAPPAIFGDGGLLSGLFGSETAQNRTSRMAGEAAQQHTQDAIAQANQDFIAREMARQPQTASQSQQTRQPIPLSVMKEYAGIYHAMAPRVKTSRDVVMGEAFRQITARAQRDLASDDPKVRNNAQREYINAMATLLNPQATLYGGLGTAQPSED